MKKYEQETIHVYRYTPKEPPVYDRFEELKSIAECAARCVEKGLTDEALLYLGTLQAKAGKLYNDVSDGVI